MTEPIRKSISLDELRWAALNYMRLEYGPPPPGNMNQDKRDAWHERLGLLTVFVTDLWERWPMGDADNGTAE